MSTESRDYAAMRADQNDAERHLASLTGGIDRSEEYADCVAEELKREDRADRQLQRENEERAARGEEILAAAFADTDTEKETNTEPENAP